MEDNTEKQPVYLSSEKPAGADRDSTPTSAKTTPPDGEQIYKIRDILFGAHARDYDKRFARLEERLIQETGELREMLRRRCDSIETYIKDEIDALQTRLKTEQQTRTTAERRVTESLQEVRLLLDHETDQLGDRLSVYQREVRRLVLEQSTTLSDEIRRQYTELADTVAQHLQEVRHDKADRAVLADLFQEIALRLNNQWRLPDLDTHRDA